MRRIGVHGIRAIRRLNVFAYEGWRAAADEGEFCIRGER